MVRKVMVFVCAVFLVVSVCSVCGAAETIKLKFAKYFPPVQRTRPFAEFCQEINKKSGGKVEISYYPGGTLLTAPKMAAGVLTGIADIGLSHFVIRGGGSP